MLNPNTSNLMDFFAINVNLIYISYRVNKIKTDPKIIYIEDYLISWNKFEQPRQPSFKEWLIHSDNKKIVKEIKTIKLLELKNISVKIGVSKIDADDKYWEYLFDTYRGYVDSN